MSLVVTSFETCPLEKVKKWKGGYAIKCPKISQVSWWSGEDTDDWISKDLRIRHEGSTCLECQEAMQKFLSICRNRKGDKE
jgi:hypothetical protein